MIYCFDIDETICTKVENSKYELAKPYESIIKLINNLYDNGHKIIIMSARGCVSKKDHTELTKNQLFKWGLKYHELLMNIKPNADFFIDDKAININDFIKNNLNSTRGLIAGSFDIIHPGYIYLFEEAKKYCNYLIVALHEDPTIERPEKNKPILNLFERKTILNSIKYIDEIIPYKSENDLLNILKQENIDIRFLGDDYKNKNFTGSDLKISIKFIDRNHGWSATKYKNLLKNIKHNEN